MPPARLTAWTPDRSSQSAAPRCVRRSDRRSPAAIAAAARRGRRTATIGIQTRAGDVTSVPLAGLAHVDGDQLAALKRGRDVGCRELGDRIPRPAATARPGPRAAQVPTPPSVTWIAWRTGIGAPAPTAIALRRPVVQITATGRTRSTAGSPHPRRDRRRRRSGDALSSHSSVAHVEVLDTVAAACRSSTSITWNRSTPSPAPVQAGRPPASTPAADRPTDSSNPCMCSAAGSASATGASWLRAPRSSHHRPDARRVDAVVPGMSAGVVLRSGHQSFRPAGVGHRRCSGAHDAVQRRHRSSRPGVPRRSP